MPSRATSHDGRTTRSRALAYADGTFERVVNASMAYGCPRCHHGLVLHERDEDNRVSACCNQDCTCGHATPDRAAKHTTHCPVCGESWEECLLTPECKAGEPEGRWFTTFGDDIDGTATDLV